MFSSRYTLLLIAAQFVTVSASGTLAQDTTQFFQSFDDVLVPDLPTGWVASPPGVWATSTSVESTGSGYNNIVVAGGDSGSIVTPILDLSQLTSGQLSFLARRTSTFDSAAVVVEASIDGGGTFPFIVIAAGDALPGVSSSYEEVSGSIPTALLGEPDVQFRLRADGSTGGNCRLDDFQISGIGGIGYASLGFGQATSIALSGVDSVAVPVVLNLIPDGSDLFGLQFDFEWSAETAVVGLERGPAVSDPGQWDLAVNIDSSTGRALLLSKTNSGLTAGSYPDILRLLVTPVPNDSSIARTDTLSIRSVIGSKSEDTGDDAFVAAGILRHIISVVRPIASFEISTDTLEFGIIESDSAASLSATVRNPTGTVPLQITSVESDNPAISVLPVQFETGPGDSTDVWVTVDAGQLGDGTFGGWVTFVHTAESSPDSLWISGRVGALSTRGDVSDDGLIDLLDLVLAIDHVVGKFILPDHLASRIDLFPFPYSDGAVDVRDLTILVRAINSGLWPDGVLLPAPAILAKAQSRQTGNLSITDRNGEKAIRVRFADGLRAVQLILTSDANLRPQYFSTPDNGSLVQTHIDQYHAGSNGYVGILAYTLDGPLSTDEEFTLAIVQSVAPTDSLRLIFATGIDRANQRVDLEFTGPTEVPLESIPDLLPAYPQPFSLSRHNRVRIGTELMETFVVAVRISDVLGRTVFRDDRSSISRAQPFTWNGTSNVGSTVSPGAYFVTFSSGSIRRTVPIMLAK